MSLADLPLEIIGEIAGESPQTYHVLVLAYPRFARSLTLGDRLDFAEKFGYDCRIQQWGKDSKIVWTLDGKLHRADGPAVDRLGDSKRWYINGELHRTDGPAVEYAICSKEWYVRGKRHRIGGPAIEFGSGSEQWYVNGRNHRIGGPAITYSDGIKIWFIDGKRHRLDGPAFEHPDGGNVWFLDDVVLSESEFAKAVAGRTL